MTSRKIRVLVVDDTVLYRKVLSDILARIPDVEVVGTASNGRIALAKIDQLKPDLLTLDFEMPEMDGLTTLGELQRLKLDVAVVMVSAHTSEGAAVTIKALEGGAFDFITKPDGTSLEQNREIPAAAAAAGCAKRVHQEVAAFDPQRRKGAAFAKAGPAGAARRGSRDAADKPPGTSPAGHPPRAFAAAPVGRIAIVAIGVSTGGPNARRKSFRNCRLPSGCRWSLSSICRRSSPRPWLIRLTRKVCWNVTEARDEGSCWLEMCICTVKQMKVVKRAGGNPQLTDDPPQNHCRPSVEPSLPVCGVRVWQQVPWGEYR